MVSARRVGAVCMLTFALLALGLGTAPLAGAQLESTASYFVPLTPQTRMLDTRLGIGAPVGSVPHNTTQRVSSSINFGATEPLGIGYASPLPFNAALPPGTATRNLTPGITIAGGGIVNAEQEAPTSAGWLSFVTMFNGSSGTVHVLLDLAGYFS